MRMLFEASIRPARLHSEGAAGNRIHRGDRRQRPRPGLRLPTFRHRVGRARYARMGVILVEWRRHRPVHARDGVRHAELSPVEWRHLGGSFTYQYFHDRDTDLDNFGDGPEYGLYTAIAYATGSWGDILYGKTYGAISEIVDIAPSAIGFNYTVNTPFFIHVERPRFAPRSPTASPDFLQPSERFAYYSPDLDGFRLGVTYAEKIQDDGAAASPMSIRRMPSMPRSSGRANTASCICARPVATSRPKPTYSPSMPALPPIRSTGSSAAPVVGQLDARRQLRLHG